MILARNHWPVTKSFWLRSVDTVMLPFFASGDFTAMLIEVEAAVESRSSALACDALSFKKHARANLQES